MIIRWWLKFCFCKIRIATFVSMRRTGTLISRQTGLLITNIEITRRVKACNRCQLVTIHTRNSMPSEMPSKYGVEHTELYTKRNQKMTKLMFSSVPCASYWRQISSLSFARIWLFNPRHVHLLSQTFKWDANVLHDYTISLNAIYFVSMINEYEITMSN